MVCVSFLPRKSPIRPRFCLPMPIKPSAMRSLGFTGAAQMREGRMNGAALAAAAVVVRKARRVRFLELLMPFLSTYSRARARVHRADQGRVLPDAHLRVSPTFSKTGRTALVVGS